MRISELLESHQMTLRDGAMVCKAGDWPSDDSAMPESEDMLSPKRLDYALQHVIGHREHLAEIVDKAQADAWGEGNIHAHMTGGGGPDNPYDGESGY